jgi:sensor c-di-GMP phosphodiesterase-like protein
MITPAQVSKLVAMLNAARIYGATAQLDWLYERGVDVANHDKLTTALDRSKLDALYRELEQ